MTITSSKKVIFDFYNLKADDFDLLKIEATNLIARNKISGKIVNLRY